MVARERDEPHRSSTPLELFFDLCFVLAVGQAAGELHHALTQGQVLHGVASFPGVFYSIWWGWMNFTWFASAYDTDDDVYRLTTMVQIAGALVLAAGVPRAFSHDDYDIITYGYVIMRMAIIVQWLRAAQSDPGHRPTTLRYAIGVALVQVGWVARLALPHSWLLPGFLVMLVADLLVPIWAQRATPTTWHPQHIAERYGLFTIIVLGEALRATSVAVQSALDARLATGALLALAGAAAVVVFAMWWLYFNRTVQHLLTSRRTAFFWGYGHYLVFASVAAVSAGLAVAVDGEVRQTHLTLRAIGYATAVPVAVYLLAVWVLQVYPNQRGLLTVAFPVTGALVLAAPFTPAPVHLIALLLTALVATTIIDSRRHRRA
jgi:low temperature requirement protein LtrA